MLASGTLAPIETLRTELGSKFPIHLEAKHVIDVKKQVWVPKLCELCSDTHPLLCVKVGTIPRGISNLPFNAVFKNADTFAFQGLISQFHLIVNNT